MAGYSFGSSYGEWSRDTSTWLQRQRDAVSRLPMWAQVVDDAGESISDGSLQMARLNRLRQAIVAADEAEFLAQGMPASEVDAFLAGLVSRTGGDGTTAREVLSHPDDAVYVDDGDMVWLSDFRANSMVRFDPSSESFKSFELPSAGANIRQILGRKGEVWGGESGTDKLVVVRTRVPGD